MAVRRAIEKKVPESLRNTAFREWRDIRDGAMRARGTSIRCKISCSATRIVSYSINLSAVAPQCVHRVSRIFPAENSLNVEAATTPQWMQRGPASCKALALGGPLPLLAISRLPRENLAMGGVCLHSQPLGIGLSSIYRFSGPLRRRTTGELGSCPPSGAGPARLDGWSPIRSEQQFCAVLDDAKATDMLGGGPVCALIDAFYEAYPCCAGIFTRAWLEQSLPTVAQVRACARPLEGAADLGFKGAPAWVCAADRFAANDGDNGLLVRAACAALDLKVSLGAPRIVDTVCCIKVDLELRADGPSLPAAARVIFAAKDSCTLLAPGSGLAGVGSYQMQHGRGGLDSVWHNDIALGRDEKQAEAGTKESMLDRAFSKIAAPGPPTPSAPSAHSAAGAGQPAESVGEVVQPQPLTAEWGGTEFRNTITGRTANSCSAGACQLVFATTAALAGKYMTRETANDGSDGQPDSVHDRGVGVKVQVGTEKSRERCQCLRLKLT